MYILVCHGNDWGYLNNLLGSKSTNTANGWTIDCGSGVYPYTCSNWYGFSEGNTIGSVSTTFNVKGKARLDFGNCYSSGTVYAYLDGNVIASAPQNTPSKTVEFDCNIGSILKITEENVAIIQFNSLNIIQCDFQKIESVKLSIRQQQNCSEKGAYVKLYDKGVQICDTESRDFSEEKVLTWTKKTLGSCRSTSFDLSNDVINFDLVNFNSTNNSDICPQVLTIKFKNGSGSTVYSNSHELNNRLNPNNCGDLAEAKKLKGKCLKLL